MFEKDVMLVTDEPAIYEDTYKTSSKADELVVKDMD